MKSTINSVTSSLDRVLEPLGSVSEIFRKTGEKLFIEGLTGSSRALFLTQLSELVRKPLLVISPDQNTAETLLGDSKYFSHLTKLKVSPLFFPSWELIPYESLSPLRETSGERLNVLDQLRSSSQLIVIAPIEAVLNYVMPRTILEKNSFTIQKGDNLDRQILETCLNGSGYTRSDMVEDRGQFSLRGDILDIFVPSFEKPVRIEFFGDEVEALRSFDVGSQVSIEVLESVRVLPVREICLDPESTQKGLKAIYEFGEISGADRSRTRELEEKIRHIGRFSGIEMYTPFFCHDRESLLDYLPDDAIIIFDDEDKVREQMSNHVSLTMVEYQNALDRGEIAAPPEDICLMIDSFNKHLEKKNTLILNPLKLKKTSDRVIHYEINSIPSMLGKFDRFAEIALEWLEGGWSVTLVAPTKGHLSRVHELLEQYDLEVAIDLGRISSGFQLTIARQIIVAEHEIFGRSHKHRYRRKSKSQSFQRGFKDLKKGDFLVHIDYGIGRYNGTKELKTGMGSGEFLEIYYSDDEKLYIPMESLGYLQKYLGGGDASPTLDKLGGVSWKHQKKKIKESIREMAEELLKLYAKREMTNGNIFTSDPVLLQEFADSFEYTETDDQMRAIDEVYSDLEKSKPMDRLVCGDVGFGKTEVAMRAAFKVIIDKKQVVVLAPTTILAQQHLNTFSERFKEYAVKIEMLSRFRTSKEQKAIIQELREGKIDIVIGTHKLLGKDVKFKELGLIIVDEEQRFGVRHKEKLKELRTTVDILTLTATPIPRTLHFSLMGTRDLSVIETPPDDRMAIKTYIRKFDESVIREAMFRELNRGGQIYFVHNKIESIQTVAEMILKIIPDIKLGIGHGQLPEKELEGVMRQFIDQKLDLLLCTTIIESGLDIPSANTIIINRADEFGLAQLYQLRGRVGRYKHQAYAYLLIPDVLTISTDARKRLTAIEELTELGSGFQLASRDLEIRGAGNMLGHKQSGHVNTIGFDLYCKLIDETVRELKGEKVESKIEPEIDLQIKGVIPKYYISDLNQRLEIYRRIYLANSLSTLNAIREEIEDRYGAVPEELEKLLDTLEIRILCQKLHISRAKIKSGEAKLFIEPSTPLNPSIILDVLDDNFILKSEFKLIVRLKGAGWRNDIILIKKYLGDLCEGLQQFQAI